MKVTTEVKKREIAELMKVEKETWSRSKSRERDHGREHRCSRTDLGIGMYLHQSRRILRILRNSLGGELLRNVYRMIGARNARWSAGTSDAEKVLGFWV